MTAIEQRHPKMAAVYQEMGTVRQKAGAELEVETASGSFRARPAASCLLDPEEGDVVLLAVPPEGALYVLAVLERDDDKPARVRIDAPAFSVSVPRGKIDLVAGEGIGMVTRGTLSFLVRRWTTDAIEADLSVRRLITRSKEVIAKADTVEGVFDTVETVAERLTQRLARSYRFVKEMDVTRSQEIDTRAEGTLVMRAKDALVNAKRLFKADGEQIHLG